MSLIFGIQSLHRAEETLATAIASNLRSQESHLHQAGLASGLCTCTGIASGKKKRKFCSSAAVIPLNLFVGVAISRCSEDADSAGNGFVGEYQIRRKRTFQVNIFECAIRPIGIVIGDGGQRVMPCQTFVALVQRMIGVSIDGGAACTYVVA